MKYIKAKLVKQLVDFFGGDFRRIDHALAVMKHAENIMVDHPDCDEQILLAAAVLHDVGVKPSEEKLGYNNGKTQEEFGLAVARELLQSIDFPPEKIQTVAEIVGNHHSKSRYDYIELEILKKADRIVNVSDPD